FNGGFMATHGAYGAMSGGIEALPAKEGYATIAIGADGAVRIGEWGTDLNADGGPYAAWRQNARLITQNGAVNERVYTGTAATWGSSINGDVVTWRSALGIDENNEVLYFVAGPSLSMPALAEALTAVSAHNSLLLDINESWVHFAAIRYADGAPVAEPLLPEGMDTTVDRYLRQSSRDFFYVMAQE
ncbi:MAG: phosphodiester glycosidase family protein, partial [Chloroflexota bacterium]